jgi:hypothetical protein
MKGEERGWAYLLCAARHRRAPGISVADRGGSGDGAEPAGHPVAATETGAPWGRSCRRRRGAVWESGDMETTARQATELET